MLGLKLIEGGSGLDYFRPHGSAYAQLIAAPLFMIGYLLWELFFSGSAS